MNLQNFRNKIRKNSLGRGTLRFLSWLYFAATEARRSLYEKGFFRVYSFPAKTVCFGNINSGGSGKTSMTALAAREVAKLGLKTAVITRGYGRKNKKRKVVVLERGRDFEKDETGDEALTLYEILKDIPVPVIVSADRRLAAEKAMELFKPEIILMDDGFQHFRLKKDLSFLLMNARSDPRRGELLPLGDMREKTDAIGRADFVILTHCEAAKEEEINRLKGFIHGKFPKTEILESVHSPENLIDPLTRERTPLSEFDEAVTVSAIGDPEAFEQNVLSAGIRIFQSWKFHDHHYFTPGEMAAIGRGAAGRPVITTFKDYARFPRGWENVLGKVYILNSQIKFLMGGYKTFMDKILEKKET